jgi:hypothetical protein
MKKILISSLAVAGLFTVSCNTEFDTDVKDVKVTNGTADFKVCIIRKLSYLWL